MKKACSSRLCRCAELTKFCSVFQKRSFTSNLTLPLPVRNMTQYPAPRLSFTTEHYCQEPCFIHVRVTADEGPLLPVNSSQQEYCITNDGDVLLAGDSWKANACTSCTCNNGTIQCFSQRCPAANCRVPVLRKGQCCPHCLGEYLGVSQ